MYENALQQSQASSMAKIGDDVKLFLFTPRMHGHLCLRPTNFNFTQGTIDELRQYDSVKAATSSLRGSNKQSLINSMIPTSQGLNIDTGVYDNLWSFTLVFDTTGKSQAYNRFGVPKTRRVLTGYILDEPVNPATMGMGMTPIINPDAMLMFTHESSLTIQSNIAAMSQMTNSITSNIDLVPQIADSTVANHDLAVLDVNNIAKCNIYDGSGGIISSPANALVSGAFESSIVVDNVNSSPIHQMSRVANAIDIAASASNDNEVSIFNELGSGGDFGFDEKDSYSKFLEIFYSNLNQPNITQEGVDATKTISIGHLDSLYPYMHLTPCNISNAPYEVIDQRNITPQNQLSSLVASNVNTFATECLIAQLQFRYASWTADRLVGTKGQWYIDREMYGSLLGDEVVESGVITSLNLFKNYMENSVFPIIENSVGEFDLIVNFDMAGMTLVDLHLLDYEDYSTGAMYQHHNRLGGLISPSVGSETQFNHNKSQLELLCNNFAGMTYTNQSSNYGNY